MDRDMSRERVLEVRVERIEVMWSRFQLDYWRSDGNKERWRDRDGIGEWSGEVEGVGDGEGESDWEFIEERWDDV